MVHKFNQLIKKKINRLKHSNAYLCALIIKNDIHNIFSVPLPLIHVLPRPRHQTYLICLALPIYRISLFSFSPGSIFLKLFSHEHIQDNSLKDEEFKHIRYFFLHLTFWHFFFVWYILIIFTYPITSVFHHSFCAHQVLQPYFRYIKSS